MSACLCNVEIHGHGKALSSLHPQYHRKSVQDFPFSSWKWPVAKDGNLNCTENRSLFCIINLIAMLTLQSAVFLDTDCCSFGCREWKVSSCCSEDQAPN